MAAKSDNPLENATLNGLAKIESGGPFEYVTRTGRDTVTFPDLGKMNWLEGERFMQDIQSLPESKWLPKYLSEKDWKLFKEENLTMVEMVAVVRAIVEHYQGVFGTSGEDGSSQS